MKFANFWEKQALLVFNSVSGKQIFARVVTQGGQKKLIQNSCGQTSNTPISQSEARDFFNLAA